MNIQCDVKKVQSGYDRKTCWVHARAGIIPNLNRIVLTTQKLRLTGSDIFYGINSIISNDLGENWSEPMPEDAFKARPDKEGGCFFVSDFSPQWHEKSGKLLGTGHTPHYINDELSPYNYKRSPAYSVFDPNSDTWQDWSFLNLPDHVLFNFSGAGSSQRLDLPDGDILLPMYCRDISKEVDTFSNILHSVIARCSFDGESLVYLSHGNFLFVEVPRGLGEPSLQENNGNYYLTLRNDEKGYLSVSKDGLNYTDPVPWRFDDGSEIGNYCTQQHWVKLHHKLFLVYTRRGLNNDHVFRHRAPLVMAEFDEEKLCLKKDTEIVVVPDHGARLGNFGVTQVSDSEAWVVAAEWMQGPNGGSDKDLTDIEKRGGKNTIFISKLGIA
jgi:hypothetical protein